MKFTLKNILLVINLMFLSSIKALPQSNKIAISISVLDKQDLSPLIGATVIMDSLSGNSAKITNNKGEAEFMIVPGLHRIQISSLGYKNLDSLIRIEAPRKLNIYLSTLLYNTEEAIIKLDKNAEALKKINTGVVNINQSTVKSIPGISGQADILQSLKLAPGVQASNEGNAGLFVRGGTPGQNLILLDNIPLFNPHHLIGFFPAFVPDYLGSIELYKGSIPVQYGEASSSVINLQTESLQGMKKASEADINAGLLSSSATLKYKYWGNRAESIISIRKTYYTFTKNVILSPIYEGNSKIILASDYDFTDGFVKQFFRINNKNSISFAFFQNSDFYNYSDNDISLTNNMEWMNRGARAEWKHSFANTSMVKACLGYSKYKNELEFNASSIEFNLSSNIEQAFFNSVFSKQSDNDKHFVLGGIELKSYSMTPDNIESYAGDFNYNTNQSFKTFELSIFLSEKYDVTEQLSIQLGGRLTYFAHLGPFTKIEQHALNRPPDTLRFATNSVVKGYLMADPRLAANYRLTNSSSIKFSLGINSQNIHLIPIGSISLPTDIWYPSTYFLGPERSKEISMGYYQNFFDKGYSLSIELYGKLFNNQAELKSSILNNFNNSQIEDNILTGKGKSYGMELSVSKTKGKAQGWLSYTLSRSLRTFPEIENGKPFPYKYDRIHDASVSLQYNITNRISVSSVFIFATGNTMTVPIERMLIQGELINRYSKPNTLRLPAYHRLDLGISYKKQLPRINDGAGISFSFSVYNAYNRKNVHYILLKAKETIEGLQINVQPEKISLYPVIPALSAKLSF